MEYSKMLTRVQLINWHFFENERICINGSTLISGENTAGKSTILDAIQLVLTTNTRKFNLAANEKGNRNLKGYVRCKVGNVGETYHRKGTVPANVALEFYEEKADRYFVMGVHLLSPDEESPVKRRWYLEECRLEELSFITDGRPSLDDQFRNRTRRIKYMDTEKQAREQFRYRLGNLDEKFFDIIPKSLAFKPMDNVKDFINKFVLSEGRVDVESLRNNIRILDELDQTLDKTKKQLASLTEIIKIFDDIDDKEKDIRINDILLKLADKEADEIEIASLKSDIDISTQTVSGLDDRLNKYNREIRGLEDEILNLNVSYKSNEASQLVDSLERRLDALEQELIKLNDSKNELSKEVGKLITYTGTVNENLETRLDFQSDLGLLLESGYEEEKIRLIRAVTEHFDTQHQKYVRKSAELDIKLASLDKEIEELSVRRSDLEKRKLSFPESTEKLRSAIEAEFRRKGIRSNVYILSDLLEITDEKWRNAVEGYLNTQKFYLVVEPEYYNTALEVYDKNRGMIHSAGIINTRKLPMDKDEDHTSLAYVVKSENRYARAYINYILGRVTRCENVLELENYNIAITPECMLYQGYVVRHINPREYKNPYIGINAYMVQLENVKAELRARTDERRLLREEIEKYSRVIGSGRNVNIELIKRDMSSLTSISELGSEKAVVEAELKIAKKHPTLIDLNNKLDEKQSALDRVNDDKEKAINERARLKNQIEYMNSNLIEIEKNLADKTKNLGDIYETSGVEYSLAEGKYKQNRKSKEPKKIFENYRPQRTQFENEKNNLLQELFSKQGRFNADYSLDFTTGTDEAVQYREAADKLSKIEIISYEEKLRSAKADCEKIFRSDFLSKMKEHIESARQEFKNLNKALENVYYGDDSYHFVITFDKRKESLYRMITSEYNIEGENNLWTSSFEAEYKDEIEDLFAKLMVGDDNGEKVIEEYTDYRSYLDYDIEIRKRNGQKQRFSDIYAEKSGSETQVPYYVAIAASFYQLYRFGNSVRIMLLDEAFDKMDDDRIKSMLEFMNGLGLQVIMATPPAKIEVIGEYVGCILTAIRDGSRSIVEEYDL